MASDTKSKPSRLLFWRKEKESQDDKDFDEKRSVIPHDTEATQLAVPMQEETKEGAVSFTTLFRFGPSPPSPLSSANRFSVYL